MNKKNENVEIALSGKLIKIKPDIIHKDGYEIILEHKDKENNKLSYMKMVLCVNWLSYVEDDFKVGDEVYINGPLIFNSGIKGYGDSRILMLVRNFVYLKEEV